MEDSDQETNALSTGSPLAGTGDVIVRVFGDVSNASAIWQCGPLFQNYEGGDSSTGWGKHYGDYGDVLIWALSRRAERFFMPDPWRPEELVRVYPSSAPKV